MMEFSVTNPDIIIGDAMTPEPLWTFCRKAGIGPHHARFQGTAIVVKAGDQIECLPHELGGFLSQYDVVYQPPEKPVVVDPQYSLHLVKRPGGDLSGWDVINPANGQPLNDRPLTFPEASSLLPPPGVK